MSPPGKGGAGLTGKQRGTGLTGAAGEYHVAAELSLRGWLATPTIKNAPGTDVLAQYRAAGILVAIQTKTASFGNPFMMDRGIERVSSAENEWVVLVKLHELLTRPSFFIVPHNHIAAAAYALHRRPRRDGQQRRSARRTLRANQFFDYEDRWDLMLQPTSRVPNLLGPVYADCVAAWGVPEGHPGMPPRK